MITIHHLENSRSLRVIWLLEELGVDYTLKTYARDKKTNLAPKEYQALHPLGKAPIVTDEDIVLAETGAIVEYFLSKYPDAGLNPPTGTPEDRAVTYWMHVAEGSLMPQLTLGLFMTIMETKPPFFMRPIIKAVTGKLRKTYHTPSVTKLLGFIEATLAQSDFITGDHMTGADIMMIYPLEATVARLPESSQLTNIRAYVERIHARPAYQRAEEKGGKQSFFN